MKLILDTNAYVGFKLGYSEIVEYLARAHIVFVSSLCQPCVIFSHETSP